MKNLINILFLVASVLVFSQSDDFKKQQLEAAKKATNFVYEANELASQDDFVSAEMEYRKALSKSTDVVAGSYNLGNAYYKKGAFDEALYRHTQAAKTAKSRAEKHRAFHNIGNILMQNKKCKEAVEAYKSALRNNPKDDESRYNLALAKECAKQQGDGEGEDENKDDKKDQNDKNQDKDDKQEEDKKKEDEGDEKDKPQDEGEKDKKEGDKDEDKDGKPQDDKKDKQGEGDKKEQQKPQPKPGQLSPQQIKNLLEAMNDQEQKVQKKINAKKAKGVKTKTDKDW